jgi:acyl-CoA thioesterase FadM
MQAARVPVRDPHPGGLRNMLASFYMNLWLRVFAYLLTARDRPRLQLPAEASRLTFRVWPSDLDTSLHMNNGRYLTLMDLGRLDTIVGSGIWRAVLREKWTPIASSIAIRFRRELKLWQKFALETRVLGWDERFITREQSFVLVGGVRDGELAARALFRGGLYDRRNKAFVESHRILAAAGVTTPSPAISADVSALLAIDQQLKV